jgi:pimeloyl-ACP methyl ester carboxylesterase
MTSKRLCTIVATVAALALAPSAAAADTQLLLVHGYGDAAAGKDCNRGTWKNALRYYEDAAGRDRSSMTTIGYYTGDDCDVQIGKAGNDTPIQDIARDLARHIYETHTRRGEPVNIVAHSMGGLVTRVALLGSAQGWEGFPPKLDVDNVVTLSTPHQGLARASDKDRQLQQMSRGSGFLGRLHARGSGLGDDWASGTDWTLIGSHEDQTVTHASGIDEGRFADQKLSYRSNPDDAGKVDHTGIRELFGRNRYDLDYWHASGDHPAHHTLNGWAPLKAAYQAATHVGDNLPR